MQALKLYGCSLFQDDFLYGSVCAYIEFYFWPKNSKYKYSHGELKDL